MRQARSSRRVNLLSSACHFLSAGLVLLLLFVNGALASDTEEITRLLRNADGVKTSSQSEFTSILAALGKRSAELSPSQQQYLRYLNGWKSAYDGRYDAALPQLKAIIDEPGDLTLRFRARATVVNVLVLATQYEEAFSQLEQMLALLPEVSDKDAREQALGIASYLYNQVGEYDLGLSYARKVIEEDWASRGACGGGQLQMEALYKSARVKSVGADFQKAVDACVKLSEFAYANWVRTYAARLHIDQGRFDEAIKLLKEHYGEVQQTQYPRLISEYDALLALAYRQTGDTALVRQFALSAIESGVKNQYTEPMVDAYRLLYLLAKERGDVTSALAFHEKYAAADKGYLDDVSARQLAYERVKHETTASKLQIDALNTENQVLQLQRENNRLYIALLIFTLGFIVFWAYKTKRSQLHFRKLSQLDGLTGIANRPHFIDQAERALANARKTQQEVCVVLCDLDHFKAINDKYGHAAGDFVLKQTVAACRMHLRPDDIFGRFGGEEFGIVLPGCSLEAARQRCEQLRAAIADVSSAQHDREATVSASFGIATTGLFDYELRQLLAHADAALYQAKRTGRNRVVAYDVSDAIEALELIAAEERVRVSGRA